MTDLTANCLLVIFEQLNFIDLLSMAQMSNQFSVLAADVFGRKYSHFQVVLRDDFSVPEKKKPEEEEKPEEEKKPEENGNSGWFGRLKNFLKKDGKEEKKKEEKKYLGFVYVSDATIEPNGYEIYLNLFKHFGHFIEKVKMQNSKQYENSKGEFLSELISKYTSDALVELEFETSNKDLLTHITRPLVNVKTVRFNRVQIVGLPQALPLNELFPSMERLELVSLKGDILKYISSPMPQLEHVSIKGVKTDIDSLYTNFFTNNLHIRSIDLNDNHPEFVQTVNSVWPQLETLSLSHFNLSDGSVEFENVEKFIIEDGEHTSPENLHFPRLQTLQIHYNCHGLDKFITFLNEHNYVRHFHLKQWGISDAKFQELIANLQNLKELTLEHDSNGYRLLTAAGIAQFLRSHEQVLRLNVINFPTKFNDQLQQRLNEDWNLSNTDDILSFSFERKTNN